MANGINMNILYLLMDYHVYDVKVQKYVARNNQY